MAISVGICRERGAPIQRYLIARFCLEYMWKYYLSTRVVHLSK